MANQITIQREPLELLILAMHRASAKKDQEVKESANSDEKWNSPIKNFKEGLWTGYRDCAEMFANQLEFILKIYGGDPE